MAPSGTGLPGGLGALVAVSQSDETGGKGCAMSIRASLIRLTPTLFLIGGAMLLRPPTILAQTDETRSPAIQSVSEGGAATSDGSAHEGWVQRWLQTVDEVRASQPHFVAPLVTTHVVLIEPYR